MGKLLSTSDSIEFLNLILAILIIFLIYFTYIFFKNKVYENLEIFLFHGKIFLYWCLTAFTIWILITQIVIFEITEGETKASWIWTVIITLLMGMYIHTTFGGLGATKLWQKIAGIIILTYLFLTGFGYVGFRFVFHFPKEVLFLLTGFWHNNMYENNTPIGLYFFRDNLPIFLAIWGLMITLQGEKKND